MVRNLWLKITDDIIEKKSDPIYEVLHDAGFLDVYVFDTYSAFTCADRWRVRHDDNLVDWLDNYHLYCIGEGDKPDPVVLLLSLRYKTLEIDMGGI